MNTAPFVRIALRYIAGGLVSYGILTPEGATAFASDPQVIAQASIALGAATAALTEGFYALAKRWGWRT
ncbi:hypothetical protein [Ketogulonicigenium vulgare]|uniref:hypothetical protein n=1 Tax=Ketogulonicigenium vulgare TaxID=92945 RepID=UPI0023592865|nr:hypothetical protein [Ketogulonicigenium vulgare]